MTETQMKFLDSIHHDPLQDISENEQYEAQRKKSKPRKKNGGQYGKKKAGDRRSSKGSDFNNNHRFRPDPINLDQQKKF